MVDVLTSSGWLKPAITLMELSQLIIQGMWDNESHLKQLPHINTEKIKLISDIEPECEGILDIPDLTEEKQGKIFGDMGDQEWELEFTVK